MFIPRRFVLVMGTTIPFCVLAAPTTELPPAPSAYAYIVVKYPTPPISLPKIKKNPKITKKITSPAFSAQAGSRVLPTPSAISKGQGKSPFSVDRKQPTPIGEQ